MKIRHSMTKKALISAVSLLTVTSSFIAPAYYGTDVFCSITASAAEETAAEYFNFKDGVILGFSEKGKAANLTELVIPEKIGGAAVTLIGNEAFYDCTSLKSVILPDSITLIGDSAFGGCENLKSIVIPDSVTLIGVRAFSNCDLRSITIPDGVESIADDAFLNCYHLTSVTIPDSVTSIGYFSFSDCRSLTEITIPASVTSIGDMSFYNCKKLETVKFLSDVPKSFNTSAFNDCGEITVVVPDEYYENWKKAVSEGSSAKDDDPLAAAVNVVSDADHVPYQTDGYFIFSDGEIRGFSSNGIKADISELVIPEEIDGTAVTSIAENAFWECDDLTSVVLPDGIESIGNEAFRFCRNLVSAEIPGSIATISDNAFEGCERLTSVKIADGVTSIGSCAFRFCESLREITIPASITSIENSAFEKCTKLETVKFLSDVPESLGTSIFSQCGGITFVVPEKYHENWKTKTSGTDFHVYSELFDANITVVADKLAESDKTEYFIFSNGVIKGLSEKGKAANITDLVIPEKIGGADVTSIGDAAFADVTSLKSVFLPYGITSIGDEAFSGCEGLASISIPDSVDSIGMRAFFHCSALKSVSLPKNLGSISESLFQMSGLKSITIPDGAVSIGDAAFSGCFYLESAVIPDSVGSIGENAFDECRVLTEIIIPANVTSIGSNAFINCKKLKIAGFLSDVPKSLGTSVFSGCGETALIVPEKYYENWKKTAAGDSLYSYSELFDADIAVVTNASELPDYIDTFFIFLDGKIKGFSERGMAAELTKLVIPEKIGGKAVTSIGKYAFAECSGLKSVTIPDSVTSIEEGAFEGCYGLESVTLPKNLESISKKLFSGCEELTSVNIPDGVESIDDCAFMWCQKLEDIRIPDSVDSIGTRAFDSCENLKEISLPASVNSIDYGAFNSCKKLETVRFHSDIPHILDINIFSNCGGITFVVPKEYYDNWVEKALGGSFHVYSELFDANIVIVAAETEPGGLNGDANCDNAVNMADVVLIMQSIANPDKYGITGSDASHITSQGNANSDVTAKKDGITNLDALVIQKYLLGLIGSLPETE